jgi:serine/threonine-protein kinase
MGEVYGADDLTLRQGVALKFLPETASQDPDVLERFRNEVRIARRVSHPNVCRVYDMAEVNGQIFLSMDNSMAKILLPCFAASDAYPATKL